MVALVALETILCVAIPIKIWNSARIEHKLQEQEKLLMTARIEALASQINPHFLFNTLTSISSLIRSQPETARMLIVKLSALLRRLLRSQDHFVTLREELEAVDEYLDIECVRFGPQLSVDKDIDPDTLDHRRAQHDPAAARRELDQARARRQDRPGRITLRRTRQAGHVRIEVIDNGVGVVPSRPAGPADHGIGLRNVNERLRVIYGARCQLHLHSVAGEGTSVRLEIPDLVLGDRISA